MTPLCWLALAIGIVVGVVVSTLLWAACGISGALAEEERYE